MQSAMKDVILASTKMSEADHSTRRPQQNSEHTNKNTGSDVSQMPPKNDSLHRLTQSSRSSEQFLLRSREREVEQAHEENLTGCMCLVLAKVPHFHWSKKKEQRLAGDQFAYDLWHRPREELDESPVQKGCPCCKSFCKCPRAWRQWLGWGGN
ncbi:uncharacterized protein EAE98_004894 [Botrytis deweyae]|uniref:Uncharacterized protein n=1 Tax=Botrytis deweyae TaxID=2478750 RepID=A0ABQ7IPP4_9HELO|nr:uncharacterized protein EAE98_004894 [Botrytis deweyae]KAF7930494.1 hypothetical protein EAE98_004894 [Botrytis deweyae]